MASLRVRTRVRTKALPRVKIKALLPRVRLRDKIREVSLKASHRDKTKVLLRVNPKVRTRVASLKARARVKIKALPRVRTRVASLKVKTRALSKASLKIRSSRNNPVNLLSRTGLGIKLTASGVRDRVTISVAMPTTSTGLLKATVMTSSSTTSAMVDAASSVLSAREENSSE